MTLGIEMGISIVIGYFMGRLIDKWLGTEPIFLIIFILFGFAAAFMAVYRAYKVAKDIDKKEEIDHVGP